MSEHISVKTNKAWWRHYCLSVKVATNLSFLFVSKQHAFVNSSLAVISARGVWMAGTEQDCFLMWGLTVWIWILARCVQLFLISMTNIFMCGRKSEELEMEVETDRKWKRSGRDGNLLRISREVFFPNKLREESCNSSGLKKTFYCLWHNQIRVIPGPRVVLCFLKYSLLVETGDRRHLHCTIQSSPVSACICFSVHIYVEAALTFCRDQMLSLWGEFYCHFRALWQVKRGYNRCGFVHSFDLQMVSRCICDLIFKIQSNV